MTKMSATFSRCGTYRYRLSRNVGGDGVGVGLFVMLNPSTADAVNDDPTIRRCRGFARAEERARLVVANLYAYRATKPADLWRAADPVGPENDRHLLNAARAADIVICAWGANAKPDRVAKVDAILRKAHATLWCLGTTKAGQPRHPLYLPRTARLVPWEMPR